VNKRTFTLPRVKIGSFTLDTEAYELITPTKGRVRLTPLQYKLLAHMMRRPGEVFTSARLLHEVWGYPSNTASADLVRVHIKKLRERIERNPNSPTFLITMGRYGYMISEDEIN
jgi:DNA-binding response OmpR family regulator